MNKIKTFAVVAMLTLSGSLSAQQIRLFQRQPLFNAANYAFYDPEVNWVDSVYYSLSLPQRVAQLMVVRVPLDMDNEKADECFCMLRVWV